MKLKLLMALSLLGMFLPFAAPAQASTPACSGATPVPITHVVVIMMENQSYNGIIGHAPYIDSLASQCALATNYHGVTYPSLPNYLAVTSGSFYGIHDDNPPSSHPISAASIFSQTSWVSYQESMPKVCDKANAYPYMVKHNPAAYYTKISCANDVPLPSNPTFTAPYTFITPNMLHDMHDGTIAQGDSWLSTFVPKVLASPGYQAGNTLLVITWDTDDRSSANRVPTLVISPRIHPGTTSNASLNHYSLLRLTEEELNLPLLGGAKAAVDMRSAFGL